MTWPWSTWRGWSQDSRGPWPGAPTARPTIPNGRMRKTCALRESTGVGAGPAWCPLPLRAGPFSTAVSRLRAKEELSRTAAQPASTGSCRPAERPGTA